MTDAAPQPVLRSQTRALLSRYTLAPRVLNAFTGERLAREAGGSLEFFDVRPYGAGDELRYVDWKAYARTGKLVTRLFQAERTSSLQLLLDTSPSMAVGGKLAAAQRVAAMLAYTSLGMRTQVHRFGGAASLRGGGRAQLPELWRFIGEAPEPSVTAPVAALQAFAAAAPYAAGMVVVLSDLFGEASLEPALVALRTRRLDVCFVQLMSAADLEPESGRFELRDSETGATLEVGPDEVALYTAAVSSRGRRRGLSRTSTEQGF
jgi:uncharacterized protein (DUF58 family)